MNKENTLSWWWLLPVILLPNAIGNLGALYTIPNIDTWYAILEKPTLNPPNWIFGPVWLTLYTLMGVALFLVWRAKSNKVKKIANQIFFIQLILNLAWSVVFFGLHEVGWALAIIIALIVLIAMNIYYYKQISKAAAWLLVPYILWVGFATYLNYSILVLN